VVLGASNPSTRGRLVGLYQSISRIGPVASLLIGGLLVETVGYRATFTILGLATVPAIALALLLPARAYQTRTDLTPQPAAQPIVAPRRGG
jgi:MFS family permease